MDNLECFHVWLLQHTKEGYQSHVQIKKLAKATYYAYAGFYIPYASVDEYRKRTSMTIRGVLCDERGVFSNRGWDYFADIDYFSDTKKPKLVDNQVDPCVRRQGIGSLGLTYVKDVLQNFGCKELSGHKNPIPNTAEEMKILTLFYENNGFLNLPENKILYKF